MRTPSTLILICIVTLATSVAQQFWDGSNTTPNGAIDGGTGTWDAASTNWTNNSGNANASFDPTLGSTFAGTAGTATLADGFTANPNALDFQTPGYTVAAIGTGALTLTTDTPFITDPGFTTITAPIAGPGSLIKEGPGTLALTAANTYTGDTVITTGTLAVAGSINTPSGQIVVGFDPGDNATLDVASSGSVSGLIVGIGGDVGSTGTARVVGGALASSGALIVGNSGTGTLEVSNGGTVSNATGFIGFLDGSFGTARVSSGTWTNSDTLSIGNLGTGTLEISGTGQVSSPGSIFGFDENATGTARVTGGSWTNATNLIIGFEGTGNLEVSGTGEVSNQITFLGLADGSNGTARISGGTWTHSQALLVGVEGTGRLDLTGGVVSAPAVFLAEDAGSTGTLHVGTGASPGILDAPFVEGGDGTATLEFNHNAPNYAFTRDGTATGAATAIIGTTAVRHTGPGTTILTGDNTYSGGTTVTDGTLSVSRDANLGARSTFTTLDGGTLQNTAAFNTSRFVVLGTSDGTLQTDANLRFNAPISGPVRSSKPATPPSFSPAKVPTKVAPPSNPAPSRPPPPEHSDAAAPRSKAAPSTPLARSTSIARLARRHRRHRARTQNRPP